MKIQKRTGDGRWAREVACAESKGTRSPCKPVKVDKLARLHLVAAVEALVEVMEIDVAFDNLR